MSARLEREFTWSQRGNGSSSSGLVPTSSSSSSWRRSLYVVVLRNAKDSENKILDFIDLTWSVEYPSQKPAVQFNAQAGPNVDFDGDGDAIRCDADAGTFYYNLMMDAVNVDHVPKKNRIPLSLSISWCTRLSYYCQRYFPTSRLNSFAFNWNRFRVRVSWKNRCGVGI